MIINRVIQRHIEEKLFKGKAVIVYGARQVGKTTLIKEIQKKYQQDSLYLNCDEPDIRERLHNKTSTELRAFLGDKKLILIDEAQRIRDIGITLKLIVDELPDIQVITTGSSSFDLSNKIVEPLTGRAYDFFLPPFTLGELRQVYSDIELSRLTERYMLYGMYPEIVIKSHEAEDTIKHITRSYLFKDILEYQNIRHSDALETLLQALALQIGNEVSYTELGKITGLHRLTIEQYIGILEKAFVIFRLRSWSKNPRKELAKSRKIYFYDTGVRNALIKNFHPLNLRQDTGALWENFIISERVKMHAVSLQDVSSYFWRTYGQQEIDLVEEIGGQITGYECKWSDTKKTKAPSQWKILYPNALFTCITRENHLKFV